MFGNLITNRQLRTLMSEKSIIIEPFAESNLKRTHYTLNPGRLLRLGDDGDWDTKFTFSDKKKTCELKANEYVNVEVKQSVRIHSDGIVGRFLTVSTNIQSGLLVVAGQIDSQYGTNGEALIFGVKNLLPVQNLISFDTRLAHVEFFDLRGITPDPIKRSAEEDAAWKARVRETNWQRADSDGVRYD